MEHHATTGRWTTKRAAFALLTLMLAMMMAAAPALAQEGGLANTSQPGPSPDRLATFSFELAIECDPPADAFFLGFIPAEGTITTPLTDPDGDGLFTGSVTVDKFGPGPAPPGTEPVSLPVQIVQGPPTGFTALGPQYRVIKDFGEVKAEDNTFSASVSFCDDGGGSGDKGGTASGDAGAGNGGGSIAKPSGGGTKVLPATGGALPIAGFLGALLVGGGLLARRITR